VSPLPESTQNRHRWLELGGRHRLTTASYYYYFIGVLWGVAVLIDSRHFGRLSSVYWVGAVDCVLLDADRKPMVRSVTESGPSS